MSLVSIPDDVHKKLNYLRLDKNMSLQALTDQLLRRGLERLERLEHLGLLLPHEPLGEKRLGSDVPKKGITITDDALHKKLNYLRLDRDMTLQALTTQLLLMGLKPEA